MGKNAKFKQQFSKIAAENLPELLVWQSHGRNLTELEKADKNNKDKTHVVESVQVPLNHKRKMKEYYKKYGYAGVSSYISIVHELHEKQQTEKEEMFMQKVEQKLKAAPASLPLNEEASNILHTV